MISMKITIELNAGEVEQFLHENHPNGYLDMPDSGKSCCHCELCNACESVLERVQAAVKDGAKEKITNEQ